MVQEPFGGEPPLVSAIMPFSDPRRVVLATKAIQLFLRQTYLRKQLVIANASGTPLVTTPHPSIRELNLGKSRTTIGGLRNLAIEAASGEWFIQWDDDDYYDPNLLAYHMAHHRDGYASCLTAQVRLDYRGNFVYLHYDQDGIPNTIFFPRSAARYPQADVGDVVGFWIEHWAFKTNIVSNTRFPANCLTIAVHHGLNVTPVETFMSGQVGPEYDGICRLGPEETTAVHDALAATYGMGFQTRRDHGPDAVTSATATDG